MRTSITFYSIDCPAVDIKMKFLLIPIVFLAISKLCHGGPLRLQKRAAFYIANETACVVDNTVYSSGDPIPTDDPCEACKCRPPGFACVLKECQVKPGCRAVRRAGHCCPEYICGCEHNGRMYRDGDEIRDSKNPCYTCHCQGSSIACAFVDCLFRVDCSPEYVVGECCPLYPHCSSSSSNSSHAAESTINPDIGTVVTTSPESETSQLDESKVEYATPEASLPEVKAAPETTVDSDSVSPYIPEVTKEEILERNNAGTTEIEATTLSNIKYEVLHENVDVEDESPVDLLNTETEIKKEYLEESGETVSHQVLTTDVSPVTTSEPTTVAGSNVEIFADETTSKQEESYTTEGASTKEEVEIEANTIEKTYRALKNFTSEDESESPETEEKSADKEQSESPETEEKSADKEQSESPEVEVKPETSEIEEKSETSEIEEKSESPETEEESESPETEEKSESPETEEKSESPETEEKSETSETEEKSESPEIEERSEASEIEEKSESPEIEEKCEASEIEEKSESPETEKSESPEIEEKTETEEKSETPEFKNPEIPEIKEESESPENKELSDLEVAVETLASEAQDNSSTSVNEIKATEHSNPPASDTTTDPIEQTTKKTDSLYYVDDKVHPTEISETVTVHVQEETTSGNEGTTTSATESKDVPTSEKPSEATVSGNEKSETTN